LPTPSGGRYELTLGWCIPVIMSEKTFSAKSSRELYVLVGELPLFAYALAEKYGYDFPLKTGKLIDGK
jgi:hypothetical protein